jgi:hypothetical protein
MIDLYSWPAGQERVVDNQRAPRPRAPSSRRRSQAITPPAPHAASPLEPQAQRVVDINALRALAPPSLRPRSQAITPPAPHAASPLEPQAQRT